MALPNALDFYLASSDFPLPESIETLRRGLPMHNQDGFADPMNEPSARQAIAHCLRAGRAVGCQAEDALHTLLDLGDERVFPRPR